MALNWKEKISSYGVITVGTFLMALAINMIYEPLSMVTGGFSGISIVVQAYTGLPLWLVTTVLNLPLFLIAAKMFGIRFLGKTIYAAISFSVALAVIPTAASAGTDYLMAALLGGTINGVGLGLVFLTGSSTGGSDLLSTILHPLFPWLSSGTLLSIIDGFIVVVGMFAFGVRIGLYSIVAVFVTSKVVDRMIEGMKFAKLLYIISDKSEEIADFVMKKIERGVTALDATGMYSGDKKKVLLCVVSRKEIFSIINIVKNADKNAFFIVSDAREVMGEGFDTWE